jgi:DNA polymerase-1
VSHIEVADQTPVGHGNVICFSVFCGPDIYFSSDTSANAQRKSLLWVDTLKIGPSSWEIFRPYFESDEVGLYKLNAVDPWRNSALFQPSSLCSEKPVSKFAFELNLYRCGEVKKVWHNYSFDRHVIENHGVTLKGFTADTMHMARLWDSNRKLVGGYSLEALTSDPKVMSDAGEMSEAGGELLRNKRGLKKVFGKAKLKKDGTPGKTLYLPPVVGLYNLHPVDP